METKAHHVLVGFFAMFLVAAGGFFILWLSNYSGGREYSQYDVVFDWPVRGLREASEVRFNGIQVGEVTRLGLDPQNPNRVIARIQVLAETPVRVDSTAQLEPQGLTGLSYIQLSGGSPEAARLYSPPRQTPPRIFAVQTQLDTLFQSSEDVLSSAQTALIRIADLLSEDNVDSLRNTLENIERLSESLANDDETLGDLRGAIATLEQTGRDVSVAAQAMQQFAEETGAYVQGDLTTATNQTNQAFADMQLAAQQLNEILEELRPSLEEFADDGIDELTLAAGDLRRLIATLDRIAIELEDDPGGFVAGEPRRTVEVPR
jgi:phospholipid/cholesterol/gamma-HCH transport system substrate-binding protein